MRKITAKQRKMIKALRFFDELDARLRDGEPMAVEDAKATMRNVTAHATAEELRVILLGLRAAAQFELRTRGKTGDDA